MWSSRRLVWPISKRLDGGKGVKVRWTPSNGHFGAGDDEVIREQLWEEHKSGAVTGIFSGEMMEIKSEITKAIYI